MTGRCYSGTAGLATCAPASMTPTQKLSPRSFIVPLIPLSLQPLTMKKPVFCSHIPTSGPQLDKTPWVILMYPVPAFTSTYTKDAPQVCFPEHRVGGAEWLISSSADGFINVMDLKEGLDEEEAFRVGPLLHRPKQDCRNNSADSTIRKAS